MPFDPKMIRQRAGEQYPEVLAGAVGVTGPTIRNWASGKGVPSANQLELIAKFYNVEIEAFFTERKRSKGAK